MTELLDYNPYGTQRISWSSSSADGSAQSQKTYIGEYSDNETGLSYLNARYYDPGRGQFLSQDTVYLSLGSGMDKREQVILLDPQSQNSYGYGRGNPIAFRDVSGEFVETVLDVLSIALSIYDYQRNSSFGNGIFLGLDLFGVIPGIPSGVGYVHHGAQVAKISKYFGDVAAATGRMSDVARATGLFAKNIGFKFTGRAWSAGKAGNDVASLVGHYVKHGEKMGYGSVGEYYKGANTLINSVDNKNVFKLEGLYGSGSVDYFDRKTNNLVGLNSKGQISTFQNVSDPAKLEKINNVIE